MLRNKKFITGVILLLLVGLLFSFFINIYTYFAEVNEIGAEFMSAQIKNISAKALTAVGIFILGFILSYIWSVVIRRNLNRMTVSETIFEKKWLVFAISLAVGIIVSVLFTGEISKDILTGFYAADSGVTDPIFGADISYYMLLRPLLITIRNMLSTTFIILFIYSLAVYYLYCVRTNETVNFKVLFEEKRIIRHLVINILILFTIKIIGFRFTMEDILFTGGERIGGGYTDIAIWLNFYRIIPIILLAIIIFSLIFLLKGKYKNLIVTIAVYPLCFVLAGGASAIVQQIIVKPNEGARESKYIQYNIDATRNAYNLADTIETEYSIQNNLTREVINNNREIVDNIRITDHKSTLIAYNQLQGIRNYYRFMDADVVPYTEDGQRKAAFISVRELSESGDMANATYVNRHMKYTHGYGIVKSPINRVTPEGQPEFLIRDIPLAYGDTDSKITQPRIYFGEAEDEYYIVNTKQSELDFSEGGQEVEYRYDGKAGIPLTPFNRIAYAIKLGDINLLTSGYITSDSRLVVNHNIINRLEKVVPLISFDQDIHIAVTADGKLKWIADGYTHSGYYPYSQYSSGGFNYIRNSVKAIVDAYDGTVELYIIDETDPIIRTYKNIYPSIFKEGDIPEDIKSQIKYPEWLFNVQSKIFTKYHVTNPATFYAGSDVWSIAREKYGEASEIKEVEPYYNITQIDKNGKPELIIMIPYTLKNKDNNLVGWLAARTDNGNYGKFISYGFEIGKHAYGTLQVENKIDNDPDISKEITLWSQGGSSVMRGNMLVIPIENSLLYVEPLYITSENSASLPEVKRIIVAYGDEIVMESSLDLAFEKLFGTSNITLPPDTQVEIIPDNIPADSSVISQVREKYELLKKAAASGNWEGFGRYMSEIDELLK
ncbi:MAG: UPF0182 family protein [Clostridia bacterium]|nr:UPF0182 family protein [Clostridia bacterium]